MHNIRVWKFQDLKVLPLFFNPASLAELKNDVDKVYWENNLPKAAYVSKPCAKVLGAYVSQKSGGHKDSKVAYCSDIDDLTFCFCVFFILWAEFRDKFMKFFWMPISPSLGGVPVPFSNRPGRITKLADFPEKLDKKFQPAWSFVQKQFEKCYFTHCVYKLWRNFTSYPLAQWHSIINR